MKSFSVFVTVLASILLASEAVAFRPQNKSAVPTVVTTVKERWVAWVDGKVVTDVKRTTYSETPAPYYNDYKKAVKRATVLKKKNKVLKKERDAARLDRDQARWKVLKTQGRLNEAMGLVLKTQRRLNEALEKITDLQKENAWLLYGLLGAGALIIMLILWLITALRKLRARASP